MRILTKYNNIRRYSPMGLAAYSFNVRHLMRQDHPDLFHLPRLWKARKTFASRVYKLSARRPEPKLRGERKVRRFIGLFRVAGLARWQRYGKVHSVRKIHAF